MEEGVKSRKDMQALENATTVRHGRRFATNLYMFTLSML
jgi:hypothetical protein